MGLQGHGVLHATGRLPAALLGQFEGQVAEPPLPVERVQHRAPPVEGVPLGYRAGEVDPESHLRGQGQGGNGPRLDVLAKPADAFVAGVLHAPQGALEAGEEDEEEHGQGQGLGDQDGAAPHVREQPELPGVQVDQGGGHGHDRKEHVSTHDQGLGIKHVGHDHEIGQEEKGQQVPHGLALHGLEAEHEGQQGHALVLPEGPAVGDDHQGQAGQGQDDAHPAGRHGPAAILHAQGIGPGRADEGADEQRDAPEVRGEGHGQGRQGHAEAALVVDHGASGSRARASRQRWAWAAPLPGSKRLAGRRRP